MSYKKESRNKQLAELADSFYSGGERQTGPNFIDILQQRSKGTVPGFKKSDVQRIARSIMEAEHRGTNPEFDDPRMYIRTKHAPRGGSTAFGPGQITRTTAKDVLDRRRINFSPETKKYIKDVYLPAGKQMIKHGRNKGKISDYDPRYDYGGDAYLANPNQMRMYNELFSGTIRQKMMDAGVTPEEVINSPTARDRFLSKYYRSGKRATYDKVFDRKMKETKRLPAFMEMAILNRMSPKPKKESR